jgi:hypothetical protein
MLEQQIFKDTIFKNIKYVNIKSPEKEISWVCPCDLAVRLLSVTARRKKTVAILIQNSVRFCNAAVDRVNGPLFLPLVVVWHRTEVEAKDRRTRASENSSRLQTSIF